MNSIGRCIAALVCVAAATAHADRSRLDEDVADSGDCELELAWERASARRSSRSYASLAQLDCGIGLRTELSATAARERSGSERTEAFDLEARTALFGAAGIGWSLTYGGSAERGGGRGWRRTAHFVALDAAWRPADGWLAEAQLASVRDREERRSLWAWTLALEHEISDRLEARAEVEDDDRSRPLTALELRYEFWPDRARLRLSFATRGGAAHERRFGAGVAFEF